MARTAPTADAKIGKKMDYLAAQLGDALAPSGFTRKARRLWRERGSGDERCFHVIDLQGDKWNEGAVGKFCINMGVQFPSLLKHLADMFDQPWHRELAEQPDTASCCPHGRLDDALPVQSAAWWTPGMVAGKDIWFEIQAGTDLALLSDVLCRSATAYLLPWLDARGSLVALFNAPGLGAHPYCQHLIAGVLLDRHADVAADFAENGARRLSGGAFAEAKTWLEAHGVQCDSADYQPAPPPAHATRRQDAFDTHRSSAEALERTLAQDATPVAARLPQLLDAFHEACRTRAGDNTSSPLWVLLQQSDAETRKQAILTILQRLPGASTDVPSLHPSVWGSGPSYDHYWGELVPMLLKDLHCDEAFAATLFALLPPLAQRVTRPGIICLATTDAFRHVVTYLCREARPWSEQCKPQVSVLLDTVRDVALADFDETARAVLALSEKDGKGLVHPDLAFRERLANYPEQYFEKPDRDMIGALRNWLRRDPDGREPLLIEDDDWGHELQAAIKRFPGDQAALLAMLADFASAPPAKVTTAFIRQANDYRAALSGASDGQAAMDWLDHLLRAYAKTSLQYEWATTVPRPGVGAFAGENSGNILLGLIRLAQVWQAGRFAVALHILADAAWTVIPGVRVRHQKAATAAIEALAASQPGKAALQAMRKQAAKPSVHKAIDAALAKAAA